MLCYELIDSQRKKLKYILWVDKSEIEQHFLLPKQKTS